MSDNIYSTEVCQKALNLLQSKLNGKLLTHLNSCVRCGLCADSCHYYLSEKSPKHIPGQKVEVLSSIYRRHFTLQGKIFPFLFGAKKMNADSIEKLKEAAYCSCTMCGRCASHCSVGVDIPYLVRFSRSLLYEMGTVPKGLKSTADLALNTGNNMGISREDLTDTLKWLEEDLQMEVNDPHAKIPLNEKGVNILYTLNPREPKFFPLSISAMAKIFYAAGEKWTISTQTFDVTNYTYFEGNEKGMIELAERLDSEIVNLESKILALGECGHGYRAYRWESPVLLGKDFSAKTLSIIEIMADYIREGKIKLDPNKNQKITTLHDPCNLVRNGGVIEEQRYILKNAVSNFIEMTPNRENNYCCGGGGGQLSISENTEKRIKAGKIKAEQIKKTGAKVVATPCHNCIDQLMELNHKYQLGVEIKTIGEIVADALVI